MDFLEIIQSHLLLSSLTFLTITFLVLRFIRDSFKVDQLTQRHVLITGCDSGFGNLLARQLDAKGIPVIAACFTEKGAVDLSAVTSSRLKTVPLNVADSASIKKAVEFVSSEVGSRGLWGLVNNAGISIPAGPTEWMKLEDFTKILDVNLLGVIDVTLHFLPLLKKAKGRVVNVASIFGRLSLIGGGYCLSKYGVEAFSDSLRLDMHHFGIKVSIIEPGFFKTAVTSSEAIKSDVQRLWNRLPQEVKDSYGEDYMQRYSKSQDFTLDLLCSSDLSKVTNCMEHALTAYYPRTRYGAGWDAKFVWIPLSYLPSFMADFVVKVLVPAPKGL
ncbi:retinol dehydrogenase 1 [Boleophthalmus pectinirostris]|uniref:retinol dehydrogenase 1 n=1 Tax=Boleophthalmus pectinirostris TaxID=150288 RepID=UPI000A1C72EE|nr:retinol dehydrogenase 1 [Boleophthalmus pectinirostris]